MLASLETFLGDAGGASGGRRWLGLPLRTGRIPQMTRLEIAGPEIAEAEGNGHAPQATSRGPRTVTILAALVALAAAVTFLVVGGGGNDHADAAPLDLSTVSDEVAAHYRYAQAHGDTFARIPCWCGCQQFLDHRNLEAEP